jgi:LysM repeat protein
MVILKKQYKKKQYKNRKKNMDTYAVAPPSDGYDYVNTDPSSPYYMWDYKLGSTAHGEVEHVYGDGRTDWVPAGSPNVTAGGPGTPGPGSPNTLSSGGIPGAPVVYTPPPVASAPPPPAPVAPSAPSNPTTPNPSVVASLDATAEQIKSDIAAIDSGTSAQDIEVLEKVADSKIMQLQNQIYQAYQGGNLTQSQMQDMEASTITMSQQAMTDQVLALEKQAAQGTMSASDQTTVEEQLQVFSANVKELTARGAISQQSELQFSTSVSNLEDKVQSLTVGSSSSEGGTTPPQTPIGSQGGGGSTSSSGSSTSGGNNPNNGDGSGGSSSSGGATTPPVVGGTLQPVSGSGSAGTSDPSGGSAPTSDSAAVAGAAYTVVHGDTLSGIAASNGVSLSQLESLNPQIKDPNLIFPGEQVNLGGGATGTTDSASGTSVGGAYTVVHGDTLSGIAASNGLSTSQIEALNPQIKDPDLIFPGEQVNLGAAGTSAASDSSQTNPDEGPLMRPSPASVPSNVGSSSDTASGGGAIGFPEKSSYPFGTIGAEAEKALGETSANSQAAGWVTGSESEATDIAKQVFEADNHPNTDPLKINEDKNGNSGA